MPYPCLRELRVKSIAANPYFLIRLILPPTLIGYSPGTQPVEIRILLRGPNHPEADWPEENKDTDDQRVQNAVDSPLHPVWKRSGEVIEDEAKGQNGKVQRRVLRACQLMASEMTQPGWKMLT